MRIMAALAGTVSERLCLIFCFAATRRLAMPSAASMAVVTLARHAGGCATILAGAFIVTRWTNLARPAFSKDALRSAQLAISFVEARHRTGRIFRTSRARP